MLNLFLRKNGSQAAASVGLGLKQGFLLGVNSNVNSGSCIIASLRNGTESRSFATISSRLFQQQEHKTEHKPEHKKSEFKKGSDDGKFKSPIKRVFIKRKTHHPPKNESSQSSVSEERVERVQTTHNNQRLDKSQDKNQKHRHHHQKPMSNERKTIEKPHTNEHQNRGFRKFRTAKIDESEDYPYKTPSEDLNQPEENHTDEFTKELEQNVDQLLQKVLQKVKVQKPMTVSNEKHPMSSSILETIESQMPSAEKDVFASLKKGEPEENLFSLEELSVIEDVAENEEDDQTSFVNIKIDATDHTFKHFKKQTFDNLPKQEQEDVIVKSSAADTNSNYASSKGVFYRKHLHDEPVSANQKYLIEFPDAEYSQLVETPTSDKMYVGHSDITQVPELRNGLHRVLQQKGVHRMFDAKSKTHFFHPYLRHLHQPDQINFDNLTPFIPPSKDPTLHKLIEEHPCKYQSSTSSITAPLVSLYLILSNFKPTKSRSLENFKFMTNTFTPSVRKPVIFVLRPKKSPSGHQFYSIDSYKFLFEPRTNQILMDLGKTMEKLFVMEPEDFEKRFVKPYAGDGRTYDDEDIYRYLRHGKFIIRSQLDCFHPKYGVFDIKTRATNPIRLNMQRYQKYTHLKLKSIKGSHNSYEREFYDMVRSVFVKYSMQGRIGDMSGMFLAYHNTLELFGFEYITLDEIDDFVFGSPHMAEKFFSLLLDMFGEILDRFTERFAGIPLKVTFRPLKVEPYFVDIFVEPMQSDEGWNEREPSDAEKLKWETDKFLPNPFADMIKGDVYCYRLSIQTLINGVASRSNVDFHKGDQVDILFALEEMGDTSTDRFLMNEYIVTLKKSFFIE